MNQYKMPFFKPPHQLLSMHGKLTEPGKFCLQNNHLPTKNLVELKDNPNIVEDNQKFMQGVYDQVLHGVGPNSSRWT